MIAAKYRDRLVRAVRRTLYRYKPIDRKLRTIPLYRSISSFGLHMYYSLGLDAQPLQRFYSENFDSIPLEDDIILFESYWGRKISCNPYAIYRALKGDARGKSMRIIWVRNKGVSTPPDVAGDPLVSFVEFESMDYARALLRARYLVSNMTFRPWFIRKKGQVYLNTWHGIPIKTLGLDAHRRLGDSANTQRNFRQATHIVTAGPYATEYTINPHGAAGDVLPRVREIGSPRIDITLTTGPDRIRSLLGIDKDRKIALYAPTWRGEGNRASANVRIQLQAIRQLKESLGDEYELLVSLHHTIRQRVSGEQLQCALVPDEIDMNEALAGVDLLISDYSSIIIDFMVLDRPIILFVPDRNEYESKRGLYIALDELPATITTTTDELAEALVSPQRPSTFKSYEPQMRRLLPAEDGHASERALDYLFVPARSVSNLSGDRRMRILVYPGGLLTNGITTSVLNLLRNIDYQRFDVTVVVDTLTVDRFQVRRERFDMIDARCKIVMRCPGFFLTRTERSAYKSLLRSEGDNPEAFDSVIKAFAREARRALGSHHYDVAIDFSGYTPFWAMMVLGIDASRRVVYQHNDLLAESSNPGRSQAQLRNVFRLYRYFDRIAAVSPGIAELNLEKLGHHYRSAEAATVATNAIDPDFVRRAALEAMPSLPEKARLHDPGVTRFINLARLSPEKNQMRLLRAFSEVVSSGIDAVLFIAGAGPLGKKLAEEAKRLYIGDRVIFTGLLTNPYPLLSVSDCFVLSSDYEGLGMVLLEAMMLGVPCIATDNPAVRTVLSGGLGRLVPPTDEALAAAMIEFARQPSGKPAFNEQEYLQGAMNQFYRNVCGADAADGLTRPPVRHMAAAVEVV